VSRRACAILAFLADQERGGRAEYGLASKEEEGEEEHTTENQEGGERKQRHGEQSCVLWCILYHFIQFARPVMRDSLQRISVFANRPGWP
jgi:hypothetical protein